MQFTKSAGLKWLMLALLVANNARAGQVDIVYEPGKKMRTIWVPPLDAKIIQFPGDLSNCMNMASVISMATADAYKIGEDQWVREVAISLDLSGINESNVEAAERTEYTLKCKFLGKDGEYVWVKIPVRIDTNGRRSDEENYVVSVPGRRLSGPKFQERINSYSRYKIKGEKLILPSDAQASAEPKEEPKEAPKMPENKESGEFNETIKGFSNFKKKG